MRLDDNYSIITTKECVELKFEEPFYNEEKGKDSVRTQVLYFPNMKMALKKYVNNKVDNCQDIEEIIDMINHLENKIDNLKL
jgi:hypothetical protein